MGYRLKTTFYKEKVRQVYLRKKKFSNFLLEQIILMRTGNVGGKKRTSEGSRKKGKIEWTKGKELE